MKKFSSKSNTNTELTSLRKFYLLLCYVIHVISECFEHNNVIISLCIPYNFRYYSVNEVQKFTFSRRIDESGADISVRYLSIVLCLVWIKCCPRYIVLFSWKLIQRYLVQYVLLIDYIYQYVVLYFKFQFLNCLLKIYMTSRKTFYVTFICL